MWRSLCLAAAICGVAALGCAGPVAVSPPPEFSEPANAALVRYWAEKLELGVDEATWRVFCAQVGPVPLQPSAVAHLDEALSQWPDAARVVPLEWEPFGSPVKTSLWPLVRHVEVRAEDVGALRGELVHLSTIRSAKVHGADAMSALASGRAMPAVTAVQGVAIDVESLEALAAARGAQLRELDVWDNELGPEMLDSLTRRGWPNLVALDVGGNRLGFALGAAVAALDAPSLRDLGVSWNQLGDGGLRALAAAPRALTRLDARGNGLTSAGVAALASLPMGGVEVLELSENELGDDGVAMLATLPLGRLEVLGLEHVQVTHVGVEALAASLGGGLVGLGLSRNELGDDGMRALCVPGLAGVRRLSLDGVHSTDAGIAALVACPHIRAVELLYVQNNPLGPAAVEAFATADLPALAALGLDGCNAGDEGLRRLTKASWWPRIEKIRLEGNQLTDAGVGHLARAVPKRLSWLYLGWNEFGAAGMSHLARAELPRLRVLSFYGTFLDSAALGALLDADWLGGLEYLDLRSVARPTPGAALDAISGRLPEGGELHRDP